MFIFCRRGFSILFISCARPNGKFRVGLFERMRDPWLTFCEVESFTLTVLQHFEHCSVGLEDAF